MRNLPNIFSHTNHNSYPRHQTPLRVTIFLWTSLFILSLYALKQPMSSIGFKLAFIIVLLLLFTLFKKTVLHPLPWLVVLIYFSYHLVTRYIVSANHHFVAVYVSIAIFIFTFNGGADKTILNFHIRILLFSILVLSGLHKLLSPEYVSGAYLQMQIDFGIFLKPPTWIAPEWYVHKEDNLTAYRKLIETNPNTAPAYILKYPIAHTPLLALAGSWLSIAMEAFAGVLIFFFSRKVISHLLLTATILGVFFFRLETGFLSLLAVMGFWLAPNKAFSITYLLLIAVFAFMIIFGLGLR